MGNVELAGFLRAARERVRPEDVGLAALGHRRTPGLRRQEVAELAAVSIEWYVRLEQGRVGTPGAAVLDGIAAALRLTPAERAHLHLIARGEEPPPVSSPSPLGGSLARILDGMPLLPAYVMDFRYDVLARNAACAALFGEGFGVGEARNVVRQLFLDADVRAANLDWARFAQETVGNVRARLARHRDDPGLLALIADMRSASPEFAAWWADQTVRERARGTKRLRHPSAGDMTFTYDTLAATPAIDQFLFVLTPADQSTETALRPLLTTHARTLAS